MGQEPFVADLVEKFLPIEKKWRCVGHLSFLRQTQMANQYDSFDQDDKRRVET